MTRHDFLKICALLGISLPLYGALNTCNSTNKGLAAKTTSHVLIIGAGAAGMAAAYLLSQQNISFTILEASNSYGGRLKDNTTFVDFPIPLGAEWLHGNTTLLNRIINNPQTTNNVALSNYNATNQVGHFENDILTYQSIFSAFGDHFNDKKFINTSWLGFFKTYIIPSIENNIIYNVAVNTINYSQNNIVVTDTLESTYTGQKIIVTTPLQLLKTNFITFTPSLPTSKTNAINAAKVWSGIKIFIHFSEKFYPSYITFANSETQTGQKLYYDAAHGQNSNQHVLGFLALGEQALPYQQLNNTQLKTFVLNEIDTIFNGLASVNYIKHISQNWDNEPFIKSAYLADIENSNIPEELSKSIADKLFFAGEAYTNNGDWGSVHNATESAFNAVAEITETTIN